MAQVFGFREKILKTLAPLKWKFFGRMFSGFNKCEFIENSIYVSVLHVIMLYILVIHCKFE